MLDRYFWISKLAFILCFEGHQNHQKMQTYGYGFLLMMVLVVVVVVDLLGMLVVVVVV